MGSIVRCEHVPRQPHDGIPLRISGQSGGGDDAPGLLQYAASRGDRCHDVFGSRPDHQRQSPRFEVDDGCSLRVQITGLATFFPGKKWIPPGAGAVCWSSRRSGEAERVYDE